MTWWCNSKIGENKNKTNPLAKISKIRVEINETETIWRINASKTWCFEKINKINRHFAWLTKQKKERTRISRLWDEEGNTTADIKESQNSIKEYFKNMSLLKMESLK